jgi:general secretion pathway protein K
MNDKGMALLMTLLIVALLAVLIFATSSGSLLAVTKARNSVSALNASYIMRSGVSAAMGLLESDAKGSTIDALSETWAEEIRQFPVGDGTVSVRTVDEASKFNINTLVSPQGRINQKAVDRLGRLLTVVGGEERLAQDAAEWLRRNREGLSYTFRDASELVLVSGGRQETVGKVEEYVTVHTDRTTERSINVNTVGHEVLRALSPKLDEALVESIIDYRRKSPFREIGELKKVQGMNDEILLTFSDVIDVKSSNFNVRAEARVLDVVRRGLAIVRRDRAGVKIIAWKEE